jgi:hypothetical protein
MELSDKIKEKLNNPKIIKGLAEHILIRNGTRRENFFPAQNHDGPEAIIDYFFQDFPNNKLVVFGNIDLQDYKNNKEDTKKFMENCYFQKEGMNVLYNYLQIINEKLGDTSKANFSTLGIFWFDKPFIPNLDNYKIKKINFSESKNNFVFGFNKYRSDELTFKKGSWQEYLAKIYVSSLKESDYFNFKKEGKDFLL